MSTDPGVLESCFIKYSRLNVAASHLSLFDSVSNNLSSELTEVIAEQIGKVTLGEIENECCGRYSRWLEAIIRTNLAWAADLPNASVLTAMVSTWFLTYKHMLKNHRDYCGAIDAGLMKDTVQLDALHAHCAKANVKRPIECNEELKNLLRKSPKVGKALACELVNQADFFVEYSKTKLPRELLPEIGKIAMKNPDISGQFCAFVSMLARKDNKIAMLVFDEFVKVLDQDPPKNIRYFEDFVNNTYNCFDDFHDELICIKLADWRLKSNRADQKEYLQLLQERIIPSKIREEKARSRRIKGLNNVKMVVHTLDSTDLMEADIIDVTGGDGPGFGRGILFTNNLFDFAETAIGQIKKQFDTRINNCVIQAQHKNAGKIYTFRDPSISITLKGKSLPFRTYSVRAYNDTTRGLSGAVVFVNVNNEDKEMQEWVNFLKYECVSN